MSTAFARRLVLAVHFGCALASLALQATFAAESISLKPEKGTLVLPILNNEKITLDFVLDSGAADVSTPADVLRPYGAPERFQRPTYCRRPLTC